MKPYISVVVAARNDDYGGDFLHRLQTFLNVLLLLSAECDLDLEAIVVEWNPPPEKPRLIDALSWPEKMNPCSVRIIEVPDEIHKTFPNSERMPMFEYLAKNAGIRRARGDFVIVTNPDLIYSKRLISHLASKRLSEKRFYRMDRYDFTGRVPSTLDVDVVMSFAKRGVFQVHVRQERNDRKAAIHIGFLRRFFLPEKLRWPCSHKQNLLAAFCGRVEKLLFADRSLPYGGIHTNASGDFILASAASLNQVRGFPEFTDTFTHLDSYLCHQLYSIGLDQVLLTPPCMILHSDHGRKAHADRPVASGEKWRIDLESIRSGRLGPILNNEGWGLADCLLSENLVG
jgi:hypothetical protein